MAIDKTKNVREPVTLSLDQVARIDDYRRMKSPIPKKSEAIRDIIDAGLDALGVKKPKKK